jgi:hypothetical protein
MTLDGGSCDGGTVTVSGCHFPANATLSTVDSAGAVVVQTNAAPVAGGADTRCGGDVLSTMTGTISTKTKALAVGAYLVRVTNPTDATFGDYASFVVSNPSGNLSGGWKAASSLVAARRSLGLTTARIDDANRFLYASPRRVGGGRAASPTVRPRSPWTAGARAPRSSSSPAERATPPARTPWSMHTSRWPARSAPGPARPGTRTSATARRCSSQAGTGYALGTKLARHGAVAESAYFYVAGGTTNDADALTTVQQVLH